MIYDCLLDKKAQSLVIARPAGWGWTKTERKTFEIVTVGDLRSKVADYDVDLSVSWGTLRIKASEIDGALVKEVLI